MEANHVKKAKNMSDAQKPGDIPTPSPEELKHEEEALNEPVQEDVRADVVKKFGLDEASQSDLVKTLVEHELEQRKAMGKAIRQKRDWREKALLVKPAEDPEDPAKGGNPADPKMEQPSLVSQIKELKAISDLDEKQLSYVETLANATGKSLSEVVTTDEFKFWNESYVRKVEEEKIVPNPSSRQPSDGNSEVSNMTPQEILALPPKDPRRKEWNKLQMEKFR